MLPTELVTRQSSLRLSGLKKSTMDKHTNDKEGAVKCNGTTDDALYAVLHVKHCSQTIEVSTLNPIPLHLQVPISIS